MTAGHKAVTINMAVVETATTAVKATTVAAEAATTAGRVTTPVGLVITVADEEAFAAEEVASAVVMPEEEVEEERLPRSMAVKDTTDRRAENRSDSRRMNPRVGTAVSRTNSSGTCNSTNGETSRRSTGGKRGAAVEAGALLSTEAECPVRPRKIETERKGRPKKSTTTSSGREEGGHDKNARQRGLAQGESGRVEDKEGGSGSVPNSDKNDGRDGGEHGGGRVEEMRLLGKRRWEEEDRGNQRQRTCCGTVADENEEKKETEAAKDVAEQEVAEPTEEASIVDGISTAAAQGASTDAVIPVIMQSKRPLMPLKRGVLQRSLSLSGGRTKASRRR
ncbi:hypothetical protein PF001_g27507 [Phytophthora fragariae]|uniref:Uncharacterized protein n=1 Tax=Phytophthora fragariae TaxID=53985 RepID=A0A6A4BHP0_9STRA|nr:hypothetical protein PF001_g27507 [Phytophthora fragariae]